MTADLITALEEALRSTLNFIENTESELGIILGCGDKARAALAASRAAPECQQPDLVTADRYGRRRVAKMYAEIETLRRSIRAEGTEAVQSAWDAVEEHIDYAYRPAALDLTPAPAVEPRTVIGGDASVAVCQICDIAGCKHVRGEAPVVEPVAQALHRSFPEAGDGRPMPPMGDDLMTAGLSADDARFVAVQLAQNGLTLTLAAEPVAWRWRPKESSVWIYDPKPEWLEMQSSDEIDAEPIYAYPPATPAQDAARVPEIAAAFDAGAMAVHREWLRAHENGEGPPRGEPDFSEAASDYAAFRAIGGDA
jgi:hypothetical protein